MCNNNEWGIVYNDFHIHGLHFKTKVCPGLNSDFDLLTINDNVFPEIIRSPSIYTNTCLYLSVYKVQDFFRNSEKGSQRICRLHILDNCRLEYMGIPQYYVELKELRDNKLYYYGKKMELKSFDLSNPVLEKTLSLQQLAEKLNINERLFEKYEFGSPFLYNEDFVIAPVLKHKIWTTGYNLARINLSNSRIHIFPLFKKMIYLDSFADDTVYYYDSMDKSVLLSYCFL